MSHIANLVEGSEDLLRVRVVDVQLDLDTGDETAVPIDLTGYNAVRLRYIINGETPATLKTMTKDADQVTNTGFAEYRFSTSDLTWTGTDDSVLVDAEIELEDGAAIVTISPDPLQFTIRRKVGD
jgi:hypothetical protein